MFPKVSSLVAKIDKESAIFLERGISEKHQFSINVHSLIVNYIMLKCYAWCYPQCQVCSEISIVCDITINSVFNCGYHL